MDNLLSRGRGGREHQAKWTLWKEVDVVQTANIIVATVPHQAIPALTVSQQFAPRKSRKDRLIHTLRERLPKKVTLPSPLRAEEHSPRERFLLFFVSISGALSLCPLCFSVVNPPLRERLEKKSLKYPCRQQTFLGRMDCRRVGRVPTNDHSVLQGAAS